ncbi:class II glutamine amidotransferase [Mycolicibacillus koreensis]|nr:class II glutamine amidotransferase [Mycolicibacillus koreensis]
MCRLFGLHAGTEVVTATFWLLDAPDSLAAQSRRNPDGTGLGIFDAQGDPVVRKQPVAAWHDTAFAAEAHELTGTSFLAHVRYATTGDLDVRNTHPFLQDGRLFAHNGVIEGLDEIDERLRAVGTDDLVAGQTDSERMFALITAAIRSCDGDVAAGITEALRWLAESVPIFSANLLLSTATDLWALRYPDSNPLYVLDRRDGATPDALELRTDRIRASAAELTGRPAVVFATEPMDDDPRWQPLTPGELVHVDADLSVTGRLVLPDPPRHRLTRAQLRPAAAAAQEANS